MMKCAIVVLALAGLSAAAPEADPQLLLNSAALPLAAPAHVFNPYSNFLYAPRVAAAPYAAPYFAPYAAPVVQALPVAVPQTPVAEVRSIIPESGRQVLGKDCASIDGCIVRDLIDAGLAVSRHAREAEAEADPQLLAYNNFPYAATVSPYAGLYNPYVANTFYNHQPYFNYYNTYAPNAPFLNYAAQPLVAAAAQPVVAAPAVQTVVKAAPVVAQTVVKAAPAVHYAAPVVAQTVVKAAPAIDVPAPVVVKAAPLPVVRAPVVETKTKKVTYTHIGSHPVHPTDVYETEQRVLY